MQHSHAQGIIRPNVSKHKPHRDARAQNDARCDKPAPGPQSSATRWRDPNTWIAVGTVALVLIGLGALWVSRDSEKRQLRAYVLVTDSGIACASCGDTEIKFPTFPGTTNAYVMVLQNSGETPASRVRVVSTWLNVGRPGAELPAHFTFPDARPDALHSFFSSSELGKDEVGTSISPLTDRAVAALKAAGANTSTVFLYGHVDYCDIFGEPHSTAYCFKYERGVGDKLPKCPRFNGGIAPRGACPSR